MRTLFAGPIIVIAARARRRPGAWLLPGLGIALAVAFAGGVAAEGVIAGDRAARATLNSLTPLQRTVRVTWQGEVTPPVDRQARALLRAVHLDAQTEVTLLNPVRLDGVIVRPAAISPLSAWLPAGAASAIAALGPCRPARCAMLQASGARLPRTLTVPGQSAPQTGNSGAGAALSDAVNIAIAGVAPLHSAVPLAYETAGAGQWPLLLTGDPTGLDALAGLSGVYRVHSWLAVLPVARSRSWQLAAVERGLRRAQASLLSSGVPFSVSAPFDGLDSARAQAASAPRRLLLAAGGAAATLALFIVLSAAALRREQRDELQRLRGAGARSGQLVAFLAGEAGLLSAAALLAGAVLAIITAAVLAASAAEPAGAVLARSVLTGTGALALAGIWLAATALMTICALAPAGRAVDVLALAAAVALIAALSTGAGSGTDQAGTWTLLLVPLCCLAAGVVVFRGAVVVLRAGGRAAVHAGPVPLRLALTGLARAPALPALTAAFIAVSIGLGGFALAYRATLSRGAADQAADQVPLDALVSPSASFQTPLALAPLARWHALAGAGGVVLPVRRTVASYTGGDGSLAVPALGVPARELTLIRGWRAGDGSAPLRVLAQRLRLPGPARNPGPLLPGGARTLELADSSRGQSVEVTADLRDPTGAIRQLPLGATGGHPSELRAGLPPGRWELEALELDEPTGELVTSGHQNGENPAPATQAQSLLALGPLRVLDAGGGSLETVRLARWLGVGAAAAAPAARRRGGDGDAAAVSFQLSGSPGLVRPAQPSDRTPVPVLADPQTAAAAGPGGRLVLSVDNLPVSARVVGVIRRFPTVAPSAGGMIVADEAVLASALDAQLPGQGRPDELWIATRDSARLRAALSAGPLAQLGSRLRADVQDRLRTAPVARSVLGTATAAALLSAALAVLGLLLALLGVFTDGRLRGDLQALGIGPRALRAELRARLACAGLLGVCAGVVVALLLTRFAVAAVGEAGAGVQPQPPLVTVVPVAGLAAWVLLTAALLALAGTVATRVQAP